MIRRVRIENEKKQRETDHHNLMRKGWSTKVMNNCHKSRNLEHRSKWYDMFQVLVQM
jgi:hypothetical protein